MPDSDNEKEAQATKRSGSQDANLLITDAVIQLTSVIETMHHRINPLSWLTPSKQVRSSGITGMVYGSITGITRAVSKLNFAPLDRLTDSLNKTPESAAHRALLSALNGVIGDYLYARQSELSIAMTFRQHGDEITLSELAKAIAKSEGKLIIMVHGLCMNDTQWTQDEHDHGYHLSRELACTTVYLHYNTGRHIYENGKQLSALLGELTTQFTSLRSQHKLAISVVAHSMGGLVIRSAHYHASIDGVLWPEHLQKIVFLGTPHHGAPLEKAGQWLDLLLGMHHFTVPLTRITQLRSAGITDLRHGYITESDTHSVNRFDFPTDQRKPIPLPEAVDCYAIATTYSESQNVMTQQLVGDGLVPLDSALGKHRDAAFHLDFKSENQWVGKNISHLALLGNKTVYDVIHKWLS